MQRLLLLILCLCFAWAAQGQEAYVWRYWFDQSPTYERGSSNDGTLHLDIDVSRLTKSLHQIHIQVRDAAGKFSEPVTRYFYVSEDGHGDCKLRCWFDQDNNTMNIVNLVQGMFDLDVSSLESGIHVLSFIAITDRGEQSDPQSRFFFVPERDDHEDAMFYYWFDENHADLVSAPVGDGALMLDVASLTDGVHMLHCYTKKDGRTSEPKHQVFMKQSVGGNAIAHYSYWLNDADTEGHIVKVDEPTNPYDLVDILPVEPQPLRSSSFHFEVTDGQPTMYAKNDIHLTFTDLYGHESKSISKQFVDVNVSEPVTGINDLQPTQTFARPEDNHIAWFMFEAAAGDTVSFKASQATTLQVFAPSGKEVYAAEGKTSVAWGKTWTQERGTHYVAVHDVTGTKANITLDYDHIRIPVFPSCSGDMDGFLAASGSQFVADSVVTMPYRIAFENDATLATASALTAVIKDTLDAKVFDLSTYQPTSIKIGDKDVQLKGDKEFVTTVDMRPAINAITQVEGLYDAKKGIATWMFTSLDPMTMEPTDDIMQGFLPVNYDGRGIGEVAFNINRKPGLPDGTEIANKASIVFDSNDPILTPVWTNIVDAEPPTSRVCDLEVVSDTIVRVNFEGKDYRSGVWKYALYVQYGKGTSWNQVAETDTTCFDFRYYEDIDYGFCVLATDSAGNVEPKIIEREYMFVNGEATMIDAIAAPQEKKAVTDKAYDLSGRLIQEEGYRGIVIRNRRKLLRR